MTNNKEQSREFRQSPCTTAFRITLFCFLSLLIFSFVQADEYTAIFDGNQTQIKSVYFSGKVYSSDFSEFFFDFAKNQVTSKPSRAFLSLPESAQLTVNVKKVEGDCRFHIYDSSGLRHFYPSVGMYTEVFIGDLYFGVIPKTYSTCQFSFSIQGVDGVIDFDLTNVPTPYQYISQNEKECDNNEMCLTFPDGSRISVTKWRSETPPCPDSVIWNGETACRDWQNFELKKRLQELGLANNDLNVPLEARFSELNQNVKSNFASINMKLDGSEKNFGDFLSYVIGGFVMLICALIFGVYWYSKSHKERGGKHVAHIDLTMSEPVKETTRRLI